MEIGKNDYPRGFPIPRDTNILPVKSYKVGICSQSGRVRQPSAIFAGIITAGGLGRVYIWNRGLYLFDGMGRRLETLITDTQSHFAKLHVHNIPFSRL